jgi:hypothetical protein
MRSPISAQKAERAVPYWRSPLFNWFASF